MSIRLTFQTLSHVPYLRIDLLLLPDLFLEVVHDVQEVYGTLLLAFGLLINLSLQFDPFKAFTFKLTVSSLGQVDTLEIEIRDHHLIVLLYMVHQVHEIILPLSELFRFRSDPLFLISKYLSL